MTSLNMPPVVPSDHFPDRTRGHVEALRKVPKVSVSAVSTVLTSDFQNLIGRQLGVWVVDTERLPIPSLLNHVGGVICAGAGKQMAGIHAASVVAVVQRHLIVPKLSAQRHTERHAMGKHDLVRSHKATDRSVTLMIYPRLPLPAIIRATAVHFRPETIKLFWGKIQAHSRLLDSGATAGDVDASPGHFLPQFYHGGQD